MGYISCEYIPNDSYFPLLQTSDLLFQSEGPDAFSQFHLYVCSAFLVRWSEKLRKMDFQVGFLRFIHSSALLMKASTGHHYVLAISTNTRLGRSRDRDVAERSIRAQFNMAECTESLQWQINSNDTMTVSKCIILWWNVLFNVSKLEMRNAGQQEYVIMIKGKVITQLE